MELELELKIKHGISKVMNNADCELWMSFQFSFDFCIEFAVHSICIGGFSIQSESNLDHHI